MNSSKTLPRTDRLSTFGSLPARKSQSFHLLPCERSGGGPGAPAEKKSESRLACDPRSTCATTAHTALGNVGHMRYRPDKYIPGAVKLLFVSPTAPTIFYVE